MDKLSENLYYTGSAIAVESSVLDVIRYLRASDSSVPIYMITATWFTVDDNRSIGFRLSDTATHTTPRHHTYRTSSNPGSCKIYYTRAPEFMKLRLWFCIQHHE